MPVLGSFFVAKKNKTCVIEHDVNDSGALINKAAVLIDDLAKTLKTSTRTIRRRMAAGTFPIPTLKGIDKKDRFSPFHVEEFLRTGKPVKSVRR